MSDNNNLMGGLLGLGALGLIGFAGYKMVESYGETQREQQRRAEAAQRARLEYAQTQQQREQRELEGRMATHIRKIDAAIDTMIADQDSIPGVIGQCVPDMDETNWEIFTRILAEKAKASDVAKVTLYLAMVTRSATQDIAQLVRHSLDEATELLVSIWQTKDEVERAGFLMALRNQAQGNVRARALLGRISS